MLPRPRGAGESTAIAVLLTAAALAAVACSERSRAASSDAAVRDGSRDAPYAETRPCEPTLPSIQENIFAVTCAFEYCHGASPATGFSFLDPHVDVHLVGAPGACPGWVIVQPGSPERSLLWQKISSDHPPCHGERMPFGKGRLPPDALACIRGWIENLDADRASASDGAPDLETGTEAAARDASGDRTLRDGAPP